ncbi:hypothetical protein FD25_GL002700 [Levilactobacillus acidifarinae DSM 19394]|uniref:Uncharacterized protein n=1 Tax=Levilactobacillus acidifarinae DSM 19394 = JCM 15949 TaxID=1423715 RepID=A0A0R1LKX9_9LACO|nr:hypothetical protein FD25_GL002700 [Levilactobacillus acidifarinae DSM 19394]
MNLEPNYYFLLRCVSYPNSHSQTALNGPSNRLQTKTTLPYLKNMATSFNLYLKYASISSYQ